MKYELVATPRCSQKKTGAAAKAGNVGRLKVPMTTSTEMGRKCLKS